MFPPGVKRHTQADGKAPPTTPPPSIPTALPLFSATHTQIDANATETASGAQCNYGETEQSVTHLSAAGIRAGLLLWRWWGKPGVSLLKHNDRQLHRQTAARADRPNIWIEDRLWGRALTEDRDVTRQTPPLPPTPPTLNTRQGTNVSNNKGLWITRRQKKPLESGFILPHADTSDLASREARLSLALRAANGLPLCATCNAAAGVSSTQYQDSVHLEAAGIQTFTAPDSLVALSSASVVPCCRVANRCISRCEHIVLMTRQPCKTSRQL